MFWGRNGGALLVLLIVTITAVAVLALADDGEASWSGEPLPAWGNDWNINQDTVYTDETIRINGSINVWAPYTLSLDGCNLIFNDSGWWSNGLYVSWGSVLYINESTSNRGVVKANTSSMDWWFSIDGEVYIQGADLYDIQDGVWSYSTYLYIEDSEINSHSYGVLSYADVHVGNSTINVMVDEDSYSWWGSGYDAYGVAAMYGDVKLYNLDINVKVDIDETFTWGSTFYGDYYTYGLYLYSANVGKLAPQANMDFSIDIDIDIALRNYYETTSYMTFRNYVNTYAIYMAGDTVVTSLKDIDITVTEDIFFLANNATRGARIYMYNYQSYVYSSISSNGVAPTEISGLHLDKVGKMKVTTAGDVYGLYEYIYCTGFGFYDSSGARQSDSITSIHDISVTNSELDLVMYMPEYGEWMLYDSKIDNVVANRMISCYFCDSDFTISDNTFTNLKAMGDYTVLFLIYSPEGEAVISGNVFKNIEGWRLWEMLYNMDRIYFEDNLITMNKQWTQSYDSWFYIHDTNDKVEFNRNIINASTFPEGLFYSRYTNENLLFEENVIEMCTFGNYMAYSYRNYADLDWALNDISNNDGPLFDIQYNYGRVTVEKNDISSNNVGADYLVYCTRTYQELRFTENSISYNAADGILFYFDGITYFTSSYQHTIDRNVLTGNTASSALNGGVMVFQGMRYNFAIRRNVFRENTGTLINFYRPYSSNSWYGYTFTVDGNEFYDNDGTASQFVDFRSYYIEVKRNVGSGNTGPLVNHILTARYVYDYHYPQCAGEMTGPIAFDINSNNYTANLGGAVNIYPAQWKDASTPYNNAGQTIKLSNNIFKDNGDGWSIRVVDFGQFPVLLNNNLYGSQYGIFLQAINYPGLWPRVKLSYTGQSYDGGGPNGMTAWGLVNVDAEFTDCSFTNYKEALYARDCQIDVYWSAIPEGSGRTEGRGYIYVWNHLEVHVTWADEMGMDSGAPAAGATLAMLGTNGRYYGALETDDMGVIGPLLIMPWSSVEGKMDQWSPYQGTILAGGLTAHYTIHVIGEQMGENALHLTVRDNVVPQVVVTTPSTGSISNLVDMPAEGFLFETGSGIASFMGYLDGGMGMEVDPAQTWMAIFNDLSQGEHTLVFEATDLAGNSANATVTFLIDALSPDLDIVSPPEIGAVTRDPALLVQGSYQDDVSDISEIVVRLNGDVLPTTTGVINEYVTLTEGVNTIIIDATDRAGNTATVRRIVTLDTYPPTLYVYTPLHQMVTSEEMLEITGLSEALTPISIEHVKASNGDLIQTIDLTAKADGRFNTVLTLLEGAQHIVFTAEDPAGNVRTITRTVTLDTTPPGLTITSPTEGGYLNTANVRLVGQVLDDNPELVMVYVNGILITHSGTINHDVPLVEGLNTIVVMAVDPVMNAAERTINVTRDTIPPILVVDTPSYVITNQQTLVIRGAVNADADKVTVAGGTVNVDEDMRFSVEKDLTDVTSPIEIVAMDRAGNSVSYTIEFVYDDERPTITLTPPPPATTSLLVIMINGSIKDNEATVTTVIVRGETFPVVDGKFNVLLTVDTGGEGWNNFTISTVDDAGNTATSKVSIQYVRERKDDEKKVSEENMWWYVGLLLIIAALVAFVTVFFFAKRGDEA